MIVTWHSPEKLRRSYAHGRVHARDPRPRIQTVSSLFRHKCHVHDGPSFLGNNESGSAESRHPGDTNTLRDRPPTQNRYDFGVGDVFGGQRDQGAIDFEVCLFFHLQGDLSLMSGSFMDINWQYNNPANPADAAIGPQIYDNHLYYS